MDRVLLALGQARGIRKEAARLLSIAPATLYQYLGEHPSSREALRQIEELVLDDVEHKLFEAIDAGDVRAVTFFLQTRGKSRGYTRHTEYSGQIQHEHRLAPPSSSEMLAVLERLHAEQQARLPPVVETVPVLAGPATADADEIASSASREAPAPEPEGLGPDDGERDP
jgi:hypothetical protein